MTDFIVLYDVDLSHISDGKQSLFIQPRVVRKYLSRRKVNHRRQRLKNVFLNSPKPEELVATCAEAMIVLRIDGNSGYTALTKNCTS